MKRFRGLFNLAVVALPLALGLGLACSAGEGESDDGGEGGDDGSGGTPTESPVDPVTGVPTGTAGETPSEPDDGPTNFDSYRSSCEEQICTEEESCKETRTGSDCMRLRPGQPCPPSDVPLVSWVDRFGGVVCFPAE